MIRLMRPVYYVYQRLRYGFSDKDCWNMDMTLAKIITKALRAFEGYPRSGHPVLYNNVKSGNSSLVWEAIIWKMIDGFELLIEDDCSEYTDEALELFANFFGALWD